MTNITPELIANLRELAQEEKVGEITNYIFAISDHLPALLDEVERLNAPMPCGHPARYAVNTYATNTPEGKRPCVACELEKALGEVERLRQRIAELEVQVAAYENDLPLAQVCERIAELEAAQRWISVEERLPDHSDMMLICVKSGFASLGFYYNGFKWGCDSSSASDVTHWRHLPEPPCDTQELD